MGNVANWTEPLRPLLGNLLTGHLANISSPAAVTDAKNPPLTLYFDKNFDERSVACHNLGKTIVSFAKVPPDFEIAQRRRLTAVLVNSLGIHPILRLSFVHWFASSEAMEAYSSENRDYADNWRSRTEPSAAIMEWCS